MTPRKTFQEPLQAECIEGQIVVTGPEHLHGAFSAEAARASARILADLADQARGGDQPSQTGSSEP